MSVADRIRKCAEIAGSGDELARKAEIPRSTLETYLAGKALPKADRLAAICYSTGVNGHWLITGEGSMLLAGVAQEVGSNAADLRLFGDAMEVIDLYLEKTKKTMSPANKRKAVDALYKLSREKNRIDPAVIEMFVQLAA